MTRYLALLLIVLAPQIAWGLDPRDHLKLTQQSCEAVGLPRLFCREVAMVSHNVDATEFDVNAAHAQRGDDETSCAAATHTVERVASRSRSVREGLELLAHSTTMDKEGMIRDVAKNLGEALHTIQDVCTHQGMSNPEHAWWSRLDVCYHWTFSPDASPQAMDCAGVETDAAMEQFMSVLGDLALDKSALDVFFLPRGPKLPAPAWLCDYLRLAPNWDGRTTRWNDDHILPMARDVMSDAFKGLGSSPVDCTDLDEETEDVILEPGLCEGVALMCPEQSHQPVLGSCQSARGSGLEGMSLVAWAVWRTRKRR